MTSEIKVGIFVIIGAVLIAVALVLLGDYSFKSYYKIFAEFSDVSGLPTKAAVKLSGVEVGKVRRMFIKGDRVVVEMQIQKGVPVYRGAKFLVGSTSVIGSKFLQINQGNASLGAITDGSIVKGEEALPLDQALTHALGSIENLVSDLRGNGRTAGSIQSILDNLRGVTADLHQMIAFSRPHIESSMAKIDTITARLDEILQKTNQLVAKVNNGDGIAGALISDPKMKNDVASAVESLKEAAGTVKESLGKVNKSRTFLLAEYKYDPDTEGGKSNAGLKLYPRDGRYYYAGGANILNVKDTQKGKEYEKINTVDAYLGWELGMFEVYGGILRGSAGAGVKVRPLHNTSFDKISFVFEGSEFSRDRQIEDRYFDSPRYDIGFNYDINKYLSAGVRANDLAEKARINYTVRLYFEDKDIASLLGLASLGAMAK